MLNSFFNCTSVGSRPDSTTKHVRKNLFFVFLTPPMLCLCTHTEKQNVAVVTFVYQVFFPASTTRIVPYQSKLVLFWVGDRADAKLSFLL